MKKILQSFTLLLLSCCLSLAGLQSAHASHIQGGQLTYRYISGDTYEVTLSFYRDCSSTLTLDPTIGITATSACNVTGVSATLTQVVGSVTTGTGYCPSIQALAVCTSGNPYPNFQKADYRGTINLPPAANWIIAYYSSARPSTANLVGQDGFQFEATLNNLVTVNGVATRVNNSSPTFSANDIPVPFVIVRQQTSINFTAATEVDGDSLVYELDRPLASCGLYVPYAVRPAGSASGCVTQVLPGTAAGTSCIISCGTIGGANFTAQLPIPVANDTTGLPACYLPNQGILTRTVTPRFRFDGATGQITFTPAVFNGGAAAAGLDKYVVVGKITEYRRLPGSNRRYRVGSVRRDFLVIVINGAGNTVPTTPVITVPDPLSGAIPTNTADTTRISVLTCNYAQVRVSFTDPDNTAAVPANPLQNLNVIYTGAGTINGNLLQNGDIGTFTLLNNGTPTPEARFYFQPSAVFAGQVIRIPLRIEDNACPIKGIQTRIIEIRIRAGNQAKALASGPAGIGGQVPLSICAGGSLSLRGDVQRPDSIRQLSTNTTRLQTYSFQWTLANGRGNGLPAVTNTQGLTVSPTVSTRYLLRINPELGFAQGACGDTVSILVRVVPAPVASATPSLQRVCAGGQVLLTGTVARPAGSVGNELNDVYTYSWTGPGGATGTATTLTVRPTTVGINTYTFTATGASPFGCAATTTVQVEVVPPPTAIATAAVSQICAGAPVLLTGSVRANGSGTNLNDTYTYVWSGLGVPANATGTTLTVAPTTVGPHVYTLTATGTAQFNCSATTTVTVNVVPQPTLAVTTNNDFICPNGTATLTALATPSGGIADTYTYTWSGAGVPANTTGATLAVRPTATTTYTVTAAGGSQTNCTVTGTVTVRVTPAVTAEFVTADSVGTNGQRTNRPPVIFTFTNNTTTNATGQSPNATFTYQWSYLRIKDAAGVAVSGTETPFSTLRTPAPLKLDVSGTYRVRLTATASVAGAACTPAVREHLIIVPDIQVPNIITPNGDGLNDVFKISSANTSSKIEIYNRWGRKVYEQTNYQNTWGGDNQPAGVYYYLLTSNNGAQTKGWIEVVR